MVVAEEQKKVTDYIAKQAKFSDGLGLLRKIVLQTELDETVKWGLPTYTLDGKVAVSIAGFKNHFTLWFHQGVFLADKHKKLVNAQEGKTKSMRQWRFKSNSEVEPKLIKQYLAETVSNFKAGKIAKPERKSQLDIPVELSAALQASQKLRSRFASLTPGKQREYAEYIAGAKQEKTRLSRIDKAVDLILAGVGLNDKYK